MIKRLFLFWFSFPFFFLASFLPASSSFGHPNVYIPILIQEALPENPDAPEFELLKGIDRIQEPVTFTLPIHEDAEITRLMLIGAKYAQLRPLQRWPHNQKERWLLIDTLADLRAGTQNQRLFLTNGTGNLEAPELAKDEGTLLRIDTGTLQATIRKKNFNLFDTITVGGKALVSSGTSEGIAITDTQGTIYLSSNDPASEVALEENGPIRCAILAKGRHISPEGKGFLHYTLRLHFTKGLSRVRVIYTLRNASRLQPENAIFRSAELRIATSLKNSEVIAAKPDGEVTQTLQGKDEIELFQGLSTAAALALKDLAPRFWPTEREGSLLTHAGQTLFQTPKDAAIRHFYLQARVPGQGAILLGTRWAAEKAPQALRADASGQMAISPFPLAAQKEHVLRFYTHKTHELLFHFAPDATPPAPHFTRFQSPLIGKPLVVDWNNEAESLWEKVVSFQEEADFFLAQGWPIDDKPEATFRRRPSFSALRWLAFDPKAPSDLEPARLDLYNFLRQEAVFSSVYALRAEQRLSFYADQAIRHADDFDLHKPTAIPALQKPDGSLRSASELPQADRLPPGEIHFSQDTDTSAILVQAYWLQGDERLREAFLSWGKTLLASKTPSSSRGLAHRIYNLSHLFTQTQDDAIRRKIMEILTPFLQTKPEIGAKGGLDRQRGFFLTDDEAKAPEASVLTSILGHLLPRALGFFIDEVATREEADAIRDLLEGTSRFLIHEGWFQTSETPGGYGFLPTLSLQKPPPADPTNEAGWQAGLQAAFHAFRAAYLLAPLDKTLAQGRLLQKTAAYNPLSSPFFQDLPARQSLQNLIEYPIIYRIWRDLPMRFDRLSETSYRLAWLTPPATREIRLKVAGLPIVDWLAFDPKTRAFGKDPAQAVPFFAAQNLPKPSPAEAGEIQTWVVTLPASITTPHFAARYLSSDPRPPKAIDPEIAIETLQEKSSSDAAPSDPQNAEIPEGSRLLSCACSSLSSESIVWIPLFFFFLLFLRYRSQKEAARRASLPRSNGAA